MKDINAWRATHYSYEKQEELICQIIALLLTRRAWLSRDTSGSP